MLLSNFVGLLAHAPRLSNLILVHNNKIQIGGTCYGVQLQKGTDKV